MRRGQAFRRCTSCGRRWASADKACANCGCDRCSWAFRVDAALPGAPRKQVMRSGFRTKRDALEAMGTLQADVHDGTYVERDDKLTMRSWMATWLDGQRAQLKPASHDGYSRCWAYLEPRIGDLRLGALDGPTLTKTYAALALGGGRDGAPLALRTVKYVHAVLRKALSDAVKQAK